MAQTTPWLEALQQAGAILLTTENPDEALQRLASLFGTQLAVDRVSILQRALDGTVTLRAGVGLPPAVPIGQEIESRPGSITHWVLEHKKSRLVQGQLERADGPPSPVRSALCVPLLAHDELLGAVNFSSMTGGRELDDTDLATAEVFAALLTFAISNRRLLNEKVRAERLATIGMVAADLSHSIKNILQMLNGAFFVADQGVSQRDWELLEKGLRIAERGGKQLQRVILNLLDLSKDRPPDKEPVVVRALLDSLAEDFTTSARQTLLIEVQSTLDDAVLLDAERLRRALANLVTNALEVVPPADGRVLLSTGREGEALLVAVEDNGPGIEPAALARIFEPFYSTKGSKGTGLGLAMVKKFCEESGGCVRAGPSETLGGLRIELVLPYEPVG